MIAEKTIALFGKNADFNKLTETQRNQVYARVVESAGKPDKLTNTVGKWMSHGGRSLIVLSISISVYEIYTAEDRLSETKKQVAIAGSGIIGGAATGAVAGLVCGPGAPICVTIGAFVGGALAAWGTLHMGKSLFWWD